MFQSQTNLNFSLKCAFHSFIATYISGVLHPLDLIKTRFQSHDGKAQTENLVPHYQGIRKGLLKIYRDQGLKGVYKGFHISIFSQALATSLFFWVQGYGKMNSVLVASTMASLFGTIATQPLWVVKTRMLLNTTSGINEFNNFLFSTRQIYKQSGLMGYSKGLGLSLILSFSGVIQMYTYQILKMGYDYFQIPTTALLEKNFICGGGSKLFVVLASYPITTVRTRIQQNQYIKDEKTKKYSGIIEIIRRTTKQQGLRGFYKGFNANLIKGIFQKGIYFYIYQLLKLNFGKTNDNN